MAVRWAITGGTWSSTSTWNGGATLGIPTVGDDVYTNGFTVTVDTSFTVDSLNNSARARDIATPAMTANNSPSPYVSNSSTGSDSFRAFNRNYGDFWAGTGSASWISIDFGTGASILIDGYTIYGTGNSTENPRNWTFEGSNNNVSWTILHTVTLPSGISNNGTYSVASIGNPLGFRYYRINISLNGGSSQFTRITELELYQPGTSTISAGGSFNFNTSGVTANITNTTSLRIGAASIINITATSGDVTLNFSQSNVGGSLGSSAFYPIISYGGNCNLTLSTGNIFGVNNNPTTSNLVILNKTSQGLLTINGNATGGNSNGGSLNDAILVTAGNTIINGNLNGLNGGNSGINAGIRQTSGNLTITGDIIGGSGAGTTNNLGVSFGGSNLIINGNVLGGSSSSSVGVVTSANNNIINGNVSGGTGVGVSTTSANIINVNGDVTASATVAAISSTNANGQVYLNGNMFNVNGKMAIYAPIIWLDQTGTTQARFFTSGGADRTLYSDNTFPNQPSTSDVRNLIKFGPSSGLTGTLIMASPTDVRSGVNTDNTVGTALFDTSQLLAELNVSSDPIAQRLRKVATPEILGQLLAAYKR